VRATESRPASDASAASRSHVAVEHAVAHLNRVLSAHARQLSFSVDEATGKTIVRVVDRDTGQLVRQIPSEEALALAARLDGATSLDSLGLDARA
jgi:flagellar protein FlaG